MNRQLKSLLALLCFSISMTAFAAEDESSESEPQAATTEEPVATMLHQKTQVKNYISLDVGDGKVDATFVKDRTGKRYGGILILPDADSGYLESGVVTNLETRLPDLGWSVMTLSLKYSQEAKIMLSDEQKIEIEIDPADAELAPESETADDAAIKEPEEKPEQSAEEAAKKQEKENIQRIQAAMTYLRQQDLPNYILLAHGDGVLSAIDILQQDVQLANVLIGVGGDIPIEELVKLPGEVLMMEVLPTGNITTKFNSRKAEMLQQNKRYVQRYITAKDKNFTGYQRPLISTIHGWLYKMFVEKVNESLLED